MQQLSKDYERLKKRTKLTLVDTEQLIELCVSECYFLWDNVIWNLLNSGPIGLSIMVVLSESYLQNLEKNAIELALRFDIAPKTFCRYVDDSHARFGSRSNATEFLNVLNSQDPQIQYTTEYENEHKELNFLDVTIKNNLNQSYDFAVYRKPAITNVQIKPHSNICPNIAMGVFKGFLSRALHICSENYLAQEIDFLINVFAENGHSITVLEKVTKKYMNNITSKKEKVNIETIKNDKIVKLPWVQKLEPKLRKEF